MTKTVKIDKRAEYLSTYNGKELCKKYSLDTYGIWKIYGEDPNCDWAGTHICPDLGYFEGELTYAIDHAVALNSFWSWGGGGEIRKETPPKNISPKAAETWMATKKEIVILESKLAAAIAKLEGVR